MTYEVYNYIFIVAAILCGVMLAVAILLFILLKIPQVIGDLSGATARKAIKNIREQNERSGDKAYKVSAYNQERGKITDQISASGNIFQNPQAQMGGLPTGKIDTAPISGNFQSGATAVLTDGMISTNGETSVLMPETSVLGQVQNETTVLSEGSGETTILSSVPGVETTVLGAADHEGETYDPAFVIEYDITYIHTDEVIA